MKRLAVPHNFMKWSKSQPVFHGTAPARVALFHEMQQILVLESEEFAPDPDSVERFWSRSSSSIIGCGVSTTPGTTQRKK